MSAPRPYETYPFHPPALFTSYTKISFLIYTKLLQIVFSMWCLHYVLKHCTFVIYACALAERLISMFSAILQSFCPYVIYIGTIYSKTMPLTLDTDASQHCVEVVVAHCSSFLFLVTTV